MFSGPAQDGFFCLVEYPRRVPQPKDSVRSVHHQISLDLDYRQVTAYPPSGGLIGFCSAPFESGSKHGFKDGRLPHEPEIVGMRTIGGAFSVVTQQIITGYVKESSHTLGL